MTWFDYIWFGGIGLGIVAIIVAFVLKKAKARSIDQ